jgi:hypothetical protein
VHRDEYGYPGMIAGHASARTDEEGRFTFRKALPGMTQISLPTNVAATSGSGVTQVILPTQLVHVKVKAGEPARVLIGDQGRLVRGELTGRDSWKGVTVRIHPTAPHIGFPGDDAMWKAFGDLAKSPIGPLLFRDKQVVNADGSFEVADMLPGDYQLFVSVPDVQNFAASTRLTIKPEIPGERPPPLDMGQIQVKSGP